jgi:hypothetical protein
MLQPAWVSQLLGYQGDQSGGSGTALNRLHSSNYSMKLLSLRSDLDSLSPFTMGTVQSLR